MLFYYVLIVRPNTAETYVVLNKHALPLRKPQDVCTRRYKRWFVSMSVIALTQLAATLTKYNMRQIIWIVCFKHLEFPDGTPKCSAGAPRAFKTEASAINGADELWMEMGYPIYGGDVVRDSSVATNDALPYRIIGRQSTRHNMERLVIWVEKLGLEE